MHTNVETKLNSSSTTQVVTAQSLEQGQSVALAVPTSELPLNRVSVAHLCATLISLLLIVITLIKTFVNGTSIDLPTVSIDSSPAPSPSSSSSAPFPSPVGGSSYSEFLPLGSPLLHPPGGWIEDLTLEGVEPNPGPRVSALELVSARGKLKKAGAKRPPHIPRAPPMTAVSVRNAPPLSRVGEIRRSGGSKYMTGENFNPRADMVGYMQTLCDAEKYPPVRLGGETMIQTALTTLHSLWTVAPGSNANQSFIFHPRAWYPLLQSTSTSSPYTYTTGFGFNASSLTTLQSLAASARVVSCKLKVYSISSATTDAGAITVGLCPADPSFTSATESFPLTSTGTGLNCNSVSGYPIIGSTSASTATQGYVEFSSEDWTDTVPLKDGASVFWLPEDPSSMTFLNDRLRQSFVTSVGATAYTNNNTQIMDPFIAIGITGATGNYVIEAFLNLEYTVTSGASNVIETTAGAMNSVQSFEVVRRVGGNLQNTVVPDPEGSLWDKAANLGSALLKGGISKASEFIFGSSDVGKAVNAFLA